MTKLIYQASVFILFMGCLSSCNPFAIQGPEPVFLDITEAEFTFDLEQGPRNQRVENVEIFFENFSIGFYELPAEIAIIPTQEISTLTIFPAIQKNGQTAEISTYDRMTTYTVEQSWEIGETYTITPEFEYKESTVFEYVETFENGNSFNFDADEIDTTNTIRTTEDSANGIYSLFISTEKGNITAANNFLFTGLVNNSKEVFVELNYKSTAIVEIGMIAEGNDISLPIPFFFLNSQSDWTKMYIDMTALFIEFPAPGYRLYLKMNGPEGENAEEAYFDNIKILRQQ